MKDGRRLLARLGELKPGAVYFRAHNLLTSGDGTPALKWVSNNAYTEDSSGNPVYDWRMDLSAKLAPACLHIMGSRRVVASAVAWLKWSERLSRKS